MKYVYLLKSLSHPDQRHVGLTSDADERLKAHNTGKSSHTAKHSPSRVAATVRFEDDLRAVEFERYLKSGSGRAFANKHLW